MFAIVRTGGKQYRVAPGDKIVVEKLAGEAGDNVDLTDVLLAGEGGDLKSTGGLTVAAKIVAQAKGDKVTVFKKRRRHNYRRKKGHRQQHTILEIVSIGGKKAEKKAEPKAEKPAAAKTEAPAKSEAAAKPAPAKAEKPAAAKTDAAPKAAKAEKPAAKSTKDAAPAKAPAKKAASKPAPKKK
ncbi:MAG TPA: 50S ribosomal protein L21 [Sphingomicrobium sp.]|nr:50S ribosomal protein L21 [Sphingomicrobium sp.]